MPLPALSARARALPTYMMATIPARKRALLAAGVDVIDLGAGDADLSPPPAAVAAMERALAEPAMHRYGFGLGLPAYREAVSAWMQRRFGQWFDPMTEVVPLIGSKEGIAHLALGFLDRGDVAVIPEPGYPAYLGGTLLSEGVAHVVPLRAADGFLVDLDALPRDVLARTKLVYLNYPNNPTTAVAPREYLERVVRTCRDRGILLVYDNAYSELAYDGYVPPSIFEVDGARDCAIEFHSLSKTYNMTGWRCGWAVGSAGVCAVLAKVKSFVDTGQFLAVQAAGVAALESWAGFVPANVAVFRERRDALVAAFRAAGFDATAPQATMYCWIPLPAGVDGGAFAARLLDDHGVVVMPGTAFGASGEGYFRVSFIAPPERLARAATLAGQVLASFR